MGHASPRAALIYQHATEDRDRYIAMLLGKMIGKSNRSRHESAGAEGSGGVERHCYQREQARAGDRDRTGMASLEGWSSTIELRPREGDQASLKTEGGGIVSCASVGV